MVRGKFIVLEGCDGVGKTTQAKLLEKRLPGAHRIAFPMRECGESGAVINAYLKGKDNSVLKGIPIEEWFTRNRREAQEIIKDHLLSGYPVICDRYYASGLAYAVACENQNLETRLHEERGLIEPDLVLWLRMPVTKLTERATFGKERYENVETQTRVDETFDKLFASTEDDEAICCHAQIIDASNSVEIVHDSIVNAVDGSMTIDSLYYV